MPSFNDIQAEIQAAQQAAQKEMQGVNDKARRKYLKLLAEYTGRDTVVYAMANNQMIEDDDIRCFMAAFHGLKNDKLDLIIHSGGGRSEATEQVVSYMRKKYKHVRAIIPVHAMSAATMLACACDEIVMGKQSAIGPIDPQFRIDNVQVAAHAILEDYERAINDVKLNPTTAAFWVPKLNKIPPGLLSTCKQTIARSKDLVAAWLHQHVKLPVAKANEIATWLAQYDHQSHGKPIDSDQAKSHGLNIVIMEDDQKLQDLILSVYHATAISLNGACVKITENHNGKGLYQVMQQQVQMPFQIQPQQQQQQKHLPPQVAPGHPAPAAAPAKPAGPVPNAKGATSFASRPSASKPKSHK
jgi:hypothetical protein